MGDILQSRREQKGAEGGESHCSSDGDVREGGVVSIFMYVCFWYIWYGDIGL